MKAKMNLVIAFILSVDIISLIISVTTTTARHIIFKIYPVVRNL
ncbi:MULTISPECIES: hypothetical protein [Borreliella]|nr:hypothetical protein [Borreliella bavariensis]